ncbi:MAG: hypothetical protein ACP5OC_03285 [Thermoplasmata archaeon]
MESADKGTSDVLFTLIKVGAILIIADAALRLVLVALVGSLAFSTGFPSGIGISVSGAFGVVVLLLVFLLVLGIVFGLMIISQARKVMENPKDSIHSIYVLVLAILAFIVGGGFIIGSLMVIVSIVLIMASGTSFSFNSPSLVGKRICPNCGLVSQGSANFCPSCGRKFQ